MRLVLDTNVFASAILWGGLPRLLLQAGREKRVSLFTSAPLLAELTDILVRRKLAALVRPATITPTVLNDPDDDQVLACAVFARADLIVSGDRHLLDLGRYGDVPLVKPAEAIRLIASARN